MTIKELMQKSQGGEQLTKAEIIQLMDEVIRLLGELEKMTQASVEYMKTQYKEANSQ